MSKRGWVYVITNQAMPGLVKVGFSTNTPSSRASKLGHTGTPHSYVVAWEIRVDSPRDVEQGAHRLLVNYREGKEWFRCSVETAKDAIQRTSGIHVHSSTRDDNYKQWQASRREADFKEEEKTRLEVLATLQRDYEARRAEIHNTFQQRLDSYASAYFPGYWFASSTAIFLALINGGAGWADTSVLTISAIAGALIAAGAVRLVARYRRGRREYMQLREDMNAKLTELDTEYSIRSRSPAKGAALEALVKAQVDNASRTRSN